MSSTEPSVPYRLIRSDRRTLALEVTPEAETVVRAPRRCPTAEIERFVRCHIDWIARQTQRQRERQQTGLARPVSPAYYAALMGLTPAGIRITGAQKRFGSCSGQNRLCFSWRLMLYPPAAIDYVVVHELAHIRHHNHSPAFYALVEQYLPDYRQRQALLRP